MFSMPYTVVLEDIMARTNVFLLVNLGCEMIYVIDQRLKAQRVSQEKSSQVMYDITSCLLEPKFIEKLMIGNPQQNVITHEHCKIMLNDIACCSMMRIDDLSMNKLWDLMTMVFKWQLTMAAHPHHLLEITFRHLDGISQLYPHVKKSILIDYTKGSIVDLWNLLDEFSQETLYENVYEWFGCFNVRISVLLRLGLQASDGNFYKTPEESYADEFIKTIGANIYTKSEQLINNCTEKESQPSCSQFENFADQLNISAQTTTNENPEMAQYVLLDDINAGIMEEDPKEEFIRLNPLRVSGAEGWKNFLHSKEPVPRKELKSLLNKKLV